MQQASKVEITPSVDVEFGQEGLCWFQILKVEITTSVDFEFGLKLRHGDYQAPK